ncbi:hypothetical protein BH23VER1_BH23VER1_09890 [soil metagenome]
MGVAFACLLGVAPAQLPTARLDSVFPLGAKTGTGVEVTVAGEELDELRGLLTNHPGIRAERTDDLRFQVDVAPDVAPGNYEMRVAGRWGVTLPRTFVVGDRDEEVVPDEAGDRATAPALTLGTVYNGRADDGRAHFFRIAARSGTRFFAECFARRIGSRMEASLVLFDGAGREVARSRGAEFGDPLLDFTPEADGELVLRVADFLARGGGDFGYRLLVRDGPQIDYVLPASAEPGKQQTFQVFGRNLIDGTPAGDGLERVEMTLAVPSDPEPRFSAPLVPAAAGTRGFHLRLGEGAAASNSIFVADSPVPPVIDGEGNTSPADAQALPLPCEVSGRLRPGMTEWFEFESTQGTRVVIEAVAQRLGAPSDLLLEVFNVATDGEGNENLAKIGGAEDEGKNLGGHAYRTDHRDPIYQFTADRAGMVRVALRDQFGTESTFRLGVREPDPSFDLLVSPPQHDEGRRVSRAGLALRRGELAIFPVMALRRDGFDGEITLSVEGLPEGVTAAPTVVAAGVDHGMICLQVAEGAAEWNGQITVSGRSGEVEKRAEPVAVSWTVNDADQEPVFAQVGSGFEAATIGEDAPLSIAVGEDKVWESSLGGKLEIPVKVASKAEIKDSITVRVTGLAGLGDKPMQVAIEKDGDAGTLVLEFFNNRDNNQFAAGTHQFALTASTKIAYRRDADRADRAEEAKEAAMAEADAKREAREQAKSALDAARAEAAAGEDRAAEEAQRIADAEALLREAEVAADRAEAERKSAEDRAKQAAERAEPRDLVATNNTMPITLKLAATPVRVAVDAAPITVVKGAGTEVPITIERLFGFADAVTVSAEFPEGMQGVSVPELAIPNGTGAGVLTIGATAEVPAGTIAFEWVAKMQFNGIDLELREPATLAVTES